MSGALPVTDEERGLRGRMNRQLSRSARSPVGLWFFEIDRVLLLILLLLIAIGLVAVAAASPASAERYSDATTKFPAMYYLWRQAAWVAVSLPVMLIVSMLPHRFLRRACLIATAVLIVLVAVAGQFGPETNGARRWIPLGFAGFQPSEFLKPVFVVSVAWLLSLRAQDPHLPMFTVTGLLTAVTCALLMRQPDFGQAMLLGLVWAAMLMVAGISPRAVAALGGAAVAAVIAAYTFYDTARVRIDAFLYPSQSDADSYRFQAERAYQTLTGGGLFGTGPSGGTAKFGLPEAHTDYIFSVVGEEFGLVTCAVIALLFLALVVRVFVRLLDDDDAFRVLAAGGLAIQFGLQAFINMAVNTGLAPAKGMTLPFISYGGSSMLALSVGAGLLLAFTRRNPYLSRSPYGQRWNKG